MTKFVKGYYKNGTWYQYGKMYSDFGTNTDGTMTQKAISNLICAIVVGSKFVVKVIGDGTTISDLACAVDNGDSFEVTDIAALVGYGLTSVTVYMNDVDITSTAYSNGRIYIASVTGNVAINVTTSNVVNTNMFTSRTTAEGITLLNNKALLKGIRGNYVTFNQRVARGSFSGSLCTATINDNIIELTDLPYSATSNSSPRISFSVTRGENHYWLYSALVYADTDTTQTYARFGMGFAPSSNNVSGTSNTTARNKNTWVTLQGIIPPTTNPNNARFMFASYQASSGVQRWMTENTKIYIKDWIVVDLTQMFGSGHEPSTVAEFLELYPRMYYINTSSMAFRNTMVSYVSKNSEDETLQTVNVDIPSLTVREGYLKVVQNTISTTGSYYDLAQAVVGEYFYPDSLNSSRWARWAAKVSRNATYRIYGYGYSGQPQYVLTDLERKVLVKYTHNGSTRETPTEVHIEQDGYLYVNFCYYNEGTEPDKLEYYVTSPLVCGLRSSYDSNGNLVYDEIKKVNGVWKAFIRVGWNSSLSELTLRNEYEILEEEEVYTLNEQDIPEELIVANQGSETISPFVVPSHGSISTSPEVIPTTAPAIMEIQYGAEPSRGLLGGGLTKGGDDDEPDEYIDEYEEEPLDDKPKDDELDEPKDEPKEEEPKDESGEEPIIDDNPQQLKK